jgi:hypothetical protein
LKNKERWNGVIHFLEINEEFVEKSSLFFFDKRGLNSVCYSVDFFLNPEKFFSAFFYPFVISLKTVLLGIGFWENLGCSFSIIQLMNMSFLSDRFSCFNFGLFQVFKTISLVE